MPAKITLCAILLVIFLLLQILQHDVVTLCISFYFLHKSQIIGKCLIKHFKNSNPYEKNLNLHMNVKRQSCTTSTST